jgi:hypothetical protein
MNLAVICFFSYERIIGEYNVLIPFVGIVGVMVFSLDKDSKFNQITNVLGSCLVSRPF